jgi:rhamnosyl/mannosyltransferase
MCDVPALVRYREKCRVVPYGIRVERFGNVAGLPASANVVGGVHARPRILFVGRLVRYKGVDVLLKALPGLDVETVIIGNGPQRVSLEALARDLGVAGRVRFLGEVSDAELLACYQACDTFVLPSMTRQETFGMVQLEAMACGRPVVSAELGTGVSWVNQHERTGLIVKPGDVDDLRRALVRLLEDASLRERLGAGARARVMSQFTAERMWSRTRALYQEISGQRASVEPVEPACVA